jgi:ribosomal 50S subunit-recycling heat shock protein
LRIDKYLKLSRLIKRRTLAQEMVEIGAVRINGRTCKPAAEVRSDDIIEIAYPGRIMKVKVVTSDEVQLKRNAPAYEMVEERKVDREERPW